MENFRAGRDAEKGNNQINAGTLFEEQYRESCRPKEKGESQPGSGHGSASVERDPAQLPPTIDFPPIPGVCYSDIATLPYLDYSWICRQPGMTWVLPQDAIKRPKYLDPGTPGRPR
ncbi:MAG: hypothetical protein AB7W16_19450 [Candidatus Obscuribacterales bacterium]